MKFKLRILKSSKSLVLLMLVSVLVFLHYLFFYDPYYKGTLLPKQDRILIVAHSAKGFKANEETLEAAEEAFTAGIDIVDLDAHLSLDKKIVIFHDFTLDKNTNSAGLVSKKTAKELKEIVLKNTNPNANDSNISTLEDYLEKFTDENQIISVELKIPGLSPTGAEQELARLLEKYQAYRRVYVNSYNLLLLYRLKSINPKIVTIFNFRGDYENIYMYKEYSEDDTILKKIKGGPWYIPYTQNEYALTLLLKVLRLDAISFHHKTKEDMVKRFQRNGYPVFIWTVNTEKDIKRSLDLYPYGLVSDNSLLAKDLMTK